MVSAAFGSETHERSEVDIYVQRAATIVYEYLLAAAQQRTFNCVAVTAAERRRGAGGR